VNSTPFAIRPWPSPPHARFSATLLCLALSACGGGDGHISRSTVQAPTGSSSQPQSASDSTQQLRTEIARLERDGVLPILDRSTDVQGPDANGNGVRDDIDAYIAALPITEIQRRAAAQMARVKQSQLLLDPMDRSSVLAASERSMAAHKCVADVFEGSAAKGYAGDLSLKIEAATANTPERAKRYLRYMAALSGASVEYPDRNTCEP
jgi:hypothetical protein